MDVVFFGMVYCDSCGLEVVRDSLYSVAGHSAGGGQWRIDGNRYKTKEPLLSQRLFVINMAATYSPAWLCSTIGHEGLNFSVRDGKR